MTVTWIGQSGYLLREGDDSILIDPYLSDAVNKIKPAPRMVEPLFAPGDFSGQAVVCTHDHLDHLDTDSVPLFRRRVLFIAPPSCESKLRALGRDKLVLLADGDSCTAAGFDITAVPAFHTVESMGIIVKRGSVTLYFTGDTLFDKRLFAVREYRPDIMFICINGKLGNMNLTEATEVTRAIAPGAAVPSHYGMFADNTADPYEFPNGFVMEYGKEYNVKEILA